MPIISSNQKFSLFSVIPFAFQNQTCTIDIEPSLVAICGKKQVVPILGSVILSCQISRSALFKISIHVSITSRDAECLNKGYFTKTVKDIVPYFSKSVITQVFETNSHQYIITHPPSNITVIVNGHVSTVSIPNEARTGAIKINLPCKSELIITDHVFIRSEFTCFDNKLQAPEILHLFLHFFFF